MSMEYIPHGIWSDELCTWVQVRHVCREHPDIPVGWAALCFGKDEAQANRVGVATAAGLDPDKCSVLAIREADRPEPHTYT